MTVVIRPEAESDLVEATEYCARGGEVAAMRFVERVESRLQFLELQPEGAPIVYAHS